MTAKQELIDAVRGLLLDRETTDSYLPLSDVADAITDIMGRELTPEEDSFVVEQFAGAVHLVLLPVELTGTQGATPGPWRTQQRCGDTPGLTSYASVRPEGAGRMIASTVTGTPAFRIDDARLIVTLRNAYWAATNLDPPYDNNEKEN